MRLTRPLSGAPLRLRCLQKNLSESFMLDEVRTGNSRHIVISRKNRLKRAQIRMIGIDNFQPCGCPGILPRSEPFLLQMSLQHLAPRPQQVFCFELLSRQMQALDIPKVAGLERLFQGDFLCTFPAFVHDDSRFDGTLLDTTQTCESHEIVQAVLQDFFVRPRARLMAPSGFLIKACLIPHGLVIASLVHPFGDSFSLTQGHEMKSRVYSKFFAFFNCTIQQILASADDRGYFRMKTDQPCTDALVQLGRGDMAHGPLSGVLRPQGSCHGAARDLASSNWIEFHFLNMERCKTSRGLNFWRAPNLWCLS
uniref:Uncharacterized protein n=1 Tax=Variovorax paradoxus (strain S110) TaxID=543728 RepID=C5CXM8_VARPS